MEKLLTANQVAEVLNCHPQSVYRNKDLPIIKLPSIGRRYKESEISRYLELKTTKPTSINSLLKTPKTIKLTNLDQFDKLYLIKNKGGNSGPMKKRKVRWNYGFGTVYLRKTKQGKDRFYIDYLVNGKRKREVVANAQGRAEAVLHLKEKSIDAFNQLHSSVKVKPTVKFAELSESYINNYAMQNKKTWKDDKCRLEVNLNPFFGKLKLNEITSLHIEKYRARRLEAGVSKSTVNRELAIMKKMYNLAIDWELTNENPVKKVKFFSEKDNLKERILSKDEEEMLLGVSPSYLKPILIVALHTGMRKGEILNLKWTQIDLSNNLIKVENTKSGRPRYININSELSSLLIVLKSNNDDRDYVFANPKTGKPYSDLKRAFKKACKKVGVDGLRFHDLRHTFASRLVEKGADLITVKDLLGHSTVKMTERYTHSNQGLKKNAVELLVKKGKKEVGEANVLAHICHTAKEKELDKDVTKSFSIN